MAQKKQLTLCIITKNDAPFLSDCVRNMKEIADEFLVVDLGSHDKTILIANQVGATVYQPKWENDFSKILNFCMDHASGKWVLFLQADEHISKEQQSELKMLLKNPNAEGYLIYRDSNQKEWSISSPTQYLRLLRNRPEYRFSFRSFAYIPDETLSSLQNCRLRITRHNKNGIGWQLAEQLQLFEKDIKEHPQNGYLQYMKGIELLNQGKVKESIAPFEITHKAVDGVRLYTPHFYKLYGISLLSQKQYEKSEKILNEGIHLAFYYSDLLILRAELYHQLDENQKALEDLESCRSLRKLPNSYMPTPEIDNSVIEQLEKEILSS